MKIPKSMGLTCCLLMIALLWGCATGRQNAPGQVTYGNPFARHMKYLPQSKADGDSAQEALENRRPAMTSAELERLGDALRRRGNLNGAYLKYCQSLAKTPEDLGLQLKIGMVLAKGGLNVDALKWFAKVIDRDPDNAAAWQGRGIAQFQRQNFGLAELSFRKALALDPDLWCAYDYLGRLLDKQKDYKGARKAYRRAIAAAPTKGFLYNNLGVSYALAGRDIHAIAAYKMAIKLKYRDDKVYNNLGLALARMGLYEQALDAFRNSQSEAGAYNNLGCVYMIQGKWNEAILSFHKAIEASPRFYTTAARNLKKAEMAAKQF